MIDYSPLMRTLRWKGIKINKLHKDGGGTVFNNHNYFTLSTLVMIHKVYKIEMNNIFTFVKDVRVKPRNYIKGFISYDKLEKLIKENGYSKRRLSVLIGSSKNITKSKGSVIANSLNKYYFGYSTLCRIANVLGVSPNDLWESTSVKKTSCTKKSINNLSNYKRGHIKLNKLFKAIKSHKISLIKLSKKLYQCKNYMYNAKQINFIPYSKLCNIAKILGEPVENLYEII